jgi:glyoxylase-like metal-dependent hydrolase (beta-lactamase superfamily II)
MGRGASSWDVVARMDGSPDQGWFEVRRYPHAVTMIREPHHREDVKSYLIEGSRDVAVLDTGTGAGDFAGLVASLSTRRPRVLQTHADWDHIGASYRFDDVLVHPAEADQLRAGYAPDRFAEEFSRESVDPSRLPRHFDASAGIPGCAPTGWLQHGDRINLGERVLEIFHTPGHSPGGVSFLDRGARALFVGDLLYLGPMLLFFPGGDPSAFRESLHLAAEIAADVDTIYPAHDSVPLTPADVHAIRDSYESVWSGRAPDRHGTLYGYRAAIYEFGRFSFNMPPGNWRA